VAARGAADAAAADADAGADADDAGCAGALDAG